MTDDSNGESTFEFVERKTDDSSTSGETVKTDSFSSLSSSTSLLMPISLSTSAGNLLSTIAPPSALPSFISNSATSLSENPVAQNKQESSKSILNAPPKALQHEIQQISTTPVATQSQQNVQNAPQAESPIQDLGMIGGGLFSWVKETVVNSNVLSKVAEKAKNSVNTMITTLDPQMREFIYSGGDVEIIVASEKDVKISPVRQAFQTVFGKATVTGIAVESSNIAAQPVGFAACVKGAEAKINSARNIPSIPNDIPVVAVENFLLKVGEDKWFDLGLLLLDDPKRKLKFHTFTQMTPVPTEIVTMAQEATPADYPPEWSGLAVTIDSLIANDLQVSQNEWHHVISGVAKRDIILLAAQSLAGLYKNAIDPV